MSEHLTPSKHTLRRAVPERQTPPEIDLIDRDEIRRMLGGISRTQAYDDPDLRALAIEMSGDERKRKRWQRHEIVALVQARIAQRDARASTIRAEAVARRERQLAKKRVNPKQPAKRGKATK